MKIFKSIILSTLILATSHVVCAAIASQEIKEERVVSRAYNFNDFATYLGMTPKDYFKFSGAYATDNASSVLPDFIDIQTHPAYVKARDLQLSGLSVPDSLILQIESIFAKNQELFADYMQMNMPELLRKQDKFEKLTLVLNGLDANLNQPTEKSSAGGVNNIDEVERIVMTAHENSIRKTSSGSYTSLTVMIYDFGMGLKNGLGGEGRVDFHTSSGYYGSQYWVVDRFRAYPTGNIFCDPEMCSFNPH